MINPMMDDYTTCCPNDCKGSKETIEENDSVLIVGCYLCDRLIEYYKHHDWSYRYYPWNLTKGDDLPTHEDFN